MSESAIVLKREITATRIPQGEALTLPPGNAGHHHPGSGRILYGRGAE